MVFISSMKDAISTILRSHIELDAFQAADAYWQVEIVPSDGSTSFSRPLSIAKQGQFISIAHYTISTYDVDYDPIVEFEIVGNDWIPVSIFKFHSGQRLVGKTITLQEANEMVKNWKNDIIDAGYADTSQARIKTIQSKL